MLQLLLFSQLYLDARNAALSPQAIASLGFLAGGVPAGYTYWELFTQHIYSKWYNEFRYSSGGTTYADAVDFLQSVKEMMAWVLSA